MNFNYFMPTRIIAGENCIENNSEVISKMGKKAIIVTGKTSAKINGSLADVEKVLKNNKQEYVIFDKVMSNPTIDCVYEGAALSKESNADFVIAIGGGSPMDSAKAIALLSSQDISREKLFSGEYESKILPMVFIPTTAGTGSEVTQYSVLTNDAAQTKTAIASPLIFPNIAFLDSKYMKSLNKTTTINTAIDALSHLIEGYLSVKANGISNALALEGIEIISSLFDNLKKFNLSDKDRSKLLYASTLGGIVIAQTGTTAVHSMGYSLTYFKNIDHGRANGLLMGEFLKFVEKEKTELINTMISKMKMNSLDEFENTLCDLLGEKEKVTNEEIEKYASIAIKSKNITNSIVIPEQNNLIEIYCKAFEV